MKQQVQKTGVRRWFGDDFVNMQKEIYEAITSIIKPAGNIVLNGVEVTALLGGTFKINAGVVALYNENKTRYEIARINEHFGLDSSAFPYYIVLDYEDYETDGVAAYGRSYVDGVTKNVIVDYKAKLQSSKPAHSNYIEITTDGGKTLSDDFFLKKSTIESLYALIGHTHDYSDIANTDDLVSGTFINPVNCEVNAGSYYRSRKVMNVIHNEMKAILEQSADAATHFEIQMNHTYRLPTDTIIIAHARAKTGSSSVEETFTVFIEVLSNTPTTLRITRADFQSFLTGTWRIYINHSHVINV
jgi:hypothetical protein